MKAATFAGPGKFEIQDIDQPPQPGPGEALVRMRNVGVCGSDLHFFRGEFPLPPGFILGHECSGEVAALGEGVKGFAVGDRVALELFTVCLTCIHCRSGNYQHCASRTASGLNAPGGLREFMTLPAYTMYKLPDEIDFELGALLEPLTVNVHGLRLVDLRFGERVAVLGAGTIGLTGIVAARAMGATYIGVTARHPHQKAMALALGADEVFDATNEGVAELAKATGGADVVMETVGGHGDTLAQAINVVGIGGRVSVLGAFTQPVQIHPIMFFLKEMKLVGANCYGRGGRRSDYELSIEIMRRNVDAMRKLITHRFPLEKIADAYATADDKSSGAIKVTITP
ncbi:MAG TPA: alcohol dehydrogenase catalytic domain-containing protein [Dehalococcoidia bacterium]|jgi:2-desacetyl-2-hydroxyethyl bacteriochlorophyllide A dehydrogenase